MLIKQKDQVQANPRQVVNITFRGKGELVCVYYVRIRLKKIGNFHKELIPFWKFRAKGDGYCENKRV